MRLTIEHATRYSYETPPRAAIEVLRLTPSSTALQTVRSWRIDTSGDAVLRRSEDAFGNITHTFTATDPGETLSIVASGVVETEWTNGIASGTRERQPAGVFLRPTPLTEVNAALRELAAGAKKAADGSPLDIAHKLNLAVHRALVYTPGATDVATPAADALAAGKGVCQDLTHVLLAAARGCGMPARYISGYRYDSVRKRDAHDPHAWAEIHVPKVGWVTFDPVAGASCTNAYVRVAVGLDFLSASPVRGSVTGGAGETLAVSVTIDASGWHQVQSVDEVRQEPAMQSPGTQTMGGMTQSADGTQTMGGMSQTAGRGQTMGGAQLKDGSQTIRKMPPPKDGPAQ